MNLVELENIKKTYISLLEDLNNELKLYFSNNEDLSKSLNQIEETIDTLFMIKRTLRNAYQTTYISKTETIADVHSYIEGINRKIEVLANLIVRAQKEEIVTKLSLDLDYKLIINSIDRYEILRSSLTEKIKEICLNTNIDDLNI